MTLDSALNDLADWVGRSGRASDPVRRAEWAAILLPHDDQEWAHRYLQALGARIPTSTCALVALRFFERLGCTCSEVSAPYAKHLGSAVSDVERVARKHKAWLVGQDLFTYPEPGDVVGVDIGNPHVLVVTGSRAEDGAVLSVDGGQSDNTRTTERARLFFAREKPELVDTADGVVVGGRVRTVYGRASGKTIAETLHLCG